MPNIVFRPPAPSTGVDNALNTIAIFLGSTIAKFDSDSIQYAGPTVNTLFQGSNFTYRQIISDTLTLPVTGRLDSLTVKLNGDLFLTIRDWTVAAKPLFQTLADGPAEFTAKLYSGNDRITVTNFADTIKGYAGNDTVFGGGGLDQLMGDSGADHLFGGLGKDSLAGGIGNDLLSGGFAPDVINGGIGNDRVYGGSGDDFLDGGAGRDLVSGGLGADTIIATIGVDRFVYDTRLGPTEVDFINGYTPAEDVILLDNDIFRALGAPGDLRNAQFHLGLSGVGAQVRILYDSATGLVFYDPTGGGGGDRVQVIQLQPGLAITADEFVIIG
jgi:Ca2+-binding RTX toxin-like protein